jgi:hypothetical protein
MFISILAKKPNFPTSLEFQDDGLVETHIIAFTVDSQRATILQRSGQLLSTGNSHDPTCAMGY